MLHELGHVYDLTVLSDRDRDAVPADHAASPRRASGGSGKTPLAEWFAEALLVVRALRRTIVSIERLRALSLRPDADAAPRSVRADQVAPRATARRRSRRRRRRWSPAIRRRRPPPPLAPAVVPGDPRRDPGAGAARAVARPRRRRRPTRPSRRRRRRRRPRRRRPRRRRRPTRRRPRPTPSAPSHAGAEPRPDPTPTPDADRDTGAEPTEPEPDGGTDPARRGRRDGAVRIMAAWTGRCSGGPRCCRRCCSR